MSTYRALLVYDDQANFIGYVINKTGTLGLKGSNIFGPEDQEDLADQLRRLNEDVDIRAHWPRLDDPDVQKLLQDESWEPIEMKWAEAVDEENSFFVYGPAPIDPETGEPLIDIQTGEPSKGQLDKEASVIATKKVLVPKHPSDVAVRNKKAMELVARARAESARM